jgi:CO/xanthine dehydrogenase FAD-binding subunit
MRAFLPDYRLRKAATLTDALGLLADRPGEWRPLAGGTDIMVQLAAGTLANRHYVGLWGIPELRRITVDAEGVTLGALTTFTDILADEILRAEFPPLGRAAAETGGVANQNRATIAGNIANASPAADTPPALLVYDAELQLVSVRGRRLVPYERFHTAYKQMDLAPDELIAAIRLPRRTGWVQHYRKVGARRAQAISKVCFAAAAVVDAGRIVDVRLAFGSVAPTVVRAFAAEAALRGAVVDRAARERAITALLRELSPIDDVRSTAAYRRQVAVNLFSAFLEALNNP